MQCSYRYNSIHAGDSYGASGSSFGLAQPQPLPSGEIIYLSISAPAIISIRGLDLQVRYLSLALTLSICPHCITFGGEWEISYHSLTFLLFLWGWGVVDIFVFISLNAERQKQRERENPQSLHHFSSTTTTGIGFSPN